MLFSVVHSLGFIDVISSRCCNTWYMPSHVNKNGYCRVHTQYECFSRLTCFTLQFINTFVRSTSFEEYFLSVLSEVYVKHRTVKSLIQLHD